jgi:hypothetical protein
MNIRVPLIAAVAALMLTPVASQAQQTNPADHDHNHPPAAADQPKAAAPAPRADMMAKMKANGEKIDALLKKMNDAKGADKTEAIAALLTALVQDHRQMHEAMMSDMGMMDMMHNMNGGHGNAKPDAKK